MAPIDIVAIEQEARRLRAEEMRRIERVCAQRMRLYFRLLAGSLLLALALFGEALRPLFSWTPQAPRSHAPRPALRVRLNRTARALFAWNPGRRHPV